MDCTENFAAHLRKQMLYGVLLSTALQIVPAAIYVTVNTASLFEPWVWIWTVIFFPFSIRLWLTLIPIFFPILFIGFISLRALSSPAKSYTTKLFTIINSFSMQSTLKCSVYLLLSLLLPLSFVALSGQSLHKSCKNRPELRCLDTDNLYIAACGFWSGIYYFFRYELCPKKIRFPIITQVKVSQIRFRLIPAITHSFRRSVTPTVYFIAVFYIFRPSIIVFSNKLYSSRLDPAFESFFQFLSLFALIKSWLMASMIYFSMWSLGKCNKVFLTEQYPFNMSQLVSALSSVNAFQEQHAFHDLYLLAMNRTGNVPEVFALSQPGGIPHTWNAILRESLRVIKEMQINMEIIFGTKSPQNNLQADEPRSNSSLPKTNLRRLVNPIPPKSSEQLTQSDFKKTFKWNSYVNSALSPFQFLYAPVLEDQIASLLENSQHVVWAVESLAVLTGRAFKEDKFGVVVNDIPTIVSLILSLRATLEKSKIGGPGKQRQRDRPGRMKAALLSAVNRGLYRIAYTYSDYLDHLYLSPESQKALKVYIS